MTSNLQVVLLVVGVSCYALNLVLATLKYFRGRGASPGSLGASIPLLLVLFAQDWPLWLRLAAAPAVVVLEFSWVPLYVLLERLFPKA
jgi:hypothetical protein